MDYDYSEKIAKRLLFDPLTKGVNKLLILTHYATPSMISWLLTTYEEKEIYDISIELVIDASATGIDMYAHEGFKQLHGNRSTTSKKKFSCSYLINHVQFEENIFIWCNGAQPIQAFTCTSDFTQPLFLHTNNSSYSECSATSAYKIYEKAISQSIYCNHSEVEDFIVICNSTSYISSPNSNISANSVCLSLITKRTGEPGKKSGLNWGQRKGRNKNEAYIPLPSHIAKSGFFPLDKQHFLVVTDDHHTLQLRVEQQNDKAITTPASNAQLGEYFRKRLGKANGAYITSMDLLTYGRRDVSFYKIDDEHYFMNFSPDK